MEKCTLCPRGCGVNRTQGQKGYCGMDSTVYLARAALHMWEEPCISGKKGSGAIFFTGCSLRCAYCQNHEIAIGTWGKPVSVQRLSEIFLELKEQGAANLNLVTGTHYVPAILQALDLARENGLDLPVVYNCGGYEQVETLRMLEGYIDVYLPDYKYAQAKLAKDLSHAEDYPVTALDAIAEMVRQTGPCHFDEEGYIRKGTIVRQLILPGHTKNSMEAVDRLLERFGKKIWISLMNQYTPLREIPGYKELSRRVTGREYQKVLDYALEAGLENGFFQEGETAAESFIPTFDCTGV